MRTATSPMDPNTLEILHLGLWKAQVTLAMMFGLAGFLTLVNPLQDISLVAGWVAAGPAAIHRVVGAIELLAAIALILPSATGWWPILTPLAAAVLAGFSVMVGVAHVLEGRAIALPVDLFLAGMALFVAWGRLIPCPIPPARPSEEHPIEGRVQTVP